MKKFILFPVAAILATIFFVSCLKNDVKQCTGYTLEQDRHIIDSFLNANGQTANYTYNTDRGWYYAKTNPGSGSTPTLDSLVAWSASGKLLSNTEFTNTKVETATYPLSAYSQDAILSFALPMLNEGGTMRIIIPSSLGYSCQGASNNSGQQVVPPNSQIIYDVTLTDVKKP